jgi:hypothetical protein
VDQGEKMADQESQVKMGNLEYLDHLDQKENLGVMDPKDLKVKRETQDL